MVGIMFHGKYDDSGKCCSVLSPPPGENIRGGDSSGILHYEHSKHTRCYPFLTVKWINEYAFIARSGWYRVGLSYI